MERKISLKKNNKETEKDLNKKVEEPTTEAGGCSPAGCESCSGCGGGIDPETMIQILAGRNKELEDKYMRLQAEYLNYKTRTQTEVSRMLQYEGEDFIKEILNIKDNFESLFLLSVGWLLLAMHGG
jgi:molecular chaperone GrpE (heat shock protein)